MPWAAAAAVTSGSFAAPSSIEYSVCTWRCANESDPADRGVLLTGGGAPQGSWGRDRRGRPAVRQGRSGWRSGWRFGGAPILALVEVYSEGLTGRVFSHADRSVTPCPRVTRSAVVAW